MSLNKLSKLQKTRVGDAILKSTSARIYPNYLIWIRRMTDSARNLMVIREATKVTADTVQTVDSRTAEARAAILALEEEEVAKIQFLLVIWTLV